MKAKSNISQNSKNISAKVHSENSRKSSHGYLEVGNDAQIHAKARALRNNNNRTETIDDD